MSARQSAISSLGLLARINGTTVTAVAKRIGRSRVQCYRAWKHPETHRPTHALLERALRIKEVPHA